MDLDKHMRHIPDFPPLHPLVRESCAHGNQRTSVNQPALDGAIPAKGNAPTAGRATCPSGPVVVGNSSDGRLSGAAGTR